MNSICKTLLFLVCSFVSYGQISPEKNLDISTKEFKVYATFTNSVNNILYQIVRYETNDQIFVQDQHGIWKNVKTQGKEKLNHISAPIYLKITNEKTERFYFLNDYFDVDLYEFKQLNSDNLLFITAPYHFYIFDLEQEYLSSKTVPGLNQYEGEDAISGLYEALFLFVDNRFLLGNCSRIWCVLL